MRDFDHLDQAIWRKQSGSGGSNAESLSNTAASKQWSARWMS